MNKNKLDQPHPTDIEYEWKAVSDFIVSGTDQAIIPWNEGWEFIGGALRRQLKEIVE